MSTPSRILHVCECLPGGPSSYLQEILPQQIERFGNGNVGLLAPGVQVAGFHGIQGLDVMATSNEKRSPLALLGFALALRRGVRSFRPDIIHLHSTLSGGIGRLVCLSLRRRPKVVYCAHGWIIDPDRNAKGRKILGFIERRLLDLTDRVINISPHETEFLKQYGIEGDKVQLILSGIKDIEPTRTNSEPREGPPRLVFIGRLDRQKGFDRLLKAAQRVSQEEVTLIAIGDVVRGNDRPSSEGIAIELTGWLPRGEVADAMAAADAIVMPSRWEGLPLVALEAMRAGKAIIATDGGAFTHLLRDGENGVLIDPEDPEFLATVLKTYSREDFEAMGQVARRDFREKYLASRMSDEICELYGDLVAENV